MKPAAALVLLILVGMAHLWAAGAGGVDLWALLQQGPRGLDQILFWQAGASRSAMAACVGAALGLGGAVLQEITRNRIVAPTTLGTAAGAWLALVLAASFAPALHARFALGIAMAGGFGASVLVLALAGMRRTGGLYVVIIGMAMNIFLGGIALVMVLLDTEAVRRLFIWGAGDLTQSDWSGVRWLAPQILAALPLALVLARGLSVLRLGADQARARGMAVVPFVGVAVLFAVWVTSAAITAVGLIGFIGLIAPGLARGLGARRTEALLLASALMGAVALLATDMIPLLLDPYVRELIPSGSAAALVGAPALVVLVFGQRRFLDLVQIAPPRGRARLGPWLQPTLLVGLFALCLAALLISWGPQGLSWWPEAPLIFELRWPRVMIAAAAGITMATCGTILQRLFRNPLASPDIVGVTSGATLGVVVAVVFGGWSLSQAALPGATLGAAGAVAGLVAINQMGRQAPALMILGGIALAATLDALVQFILSHAGDAGYILLGWLSGSTARTTAPEALVGLGLALIGLGLALARGRALDLIAIGDGTASALGVNLRRERELLLGLTAVLAAAVTAFAGPLAFVGLVAPHAARLLGAHRARLQLTLAALLGAALMVFSDHLARNLLFPRQLPAGAFASLLGGLYLFGLIAALRRTRA